MSAIDWRGLCEELLDELLARPLIPDRALIDRARATLAQPEPEVVEPSDVLDWIRGVEPWATWLAPGGSLESAHFEIARLVAEAVARWGHQPAPPAEREVVGPSDESVEAAAQVIYGSMRFDRVDSTSDWAPNGNSFAQDEARRCAHAVLSRFVRPAPAPDDRGVLPMIVSETGADDEPELERIICASISGGADYVNSMPRELSLERITPEGSTFARYIQVDADARPDVRPAPVPAGEVAELVTWLRDHAHVLNPSARSKARHICDLLERQAAPVPVASDTRYEFSVFDEDFTEQAAGSAPTYAQALSEGQHYLAQYQQDGPHTLEVRRVEVLPPGAFPVPDDAPGPEPLSPAAQAVLDAITTTVDITMNRREAAAAALRAAADQVVQLLCLNKHEDFDP